jgi:methyl-accepting chemotaxis protein
MMNRSLAVRFTVSMMQAATVIALVFGIAAWVVVSGRTHAEAVHEATLQSDNLLNRIASIDELTSAQVASGMRVLQSEGLRRGAPSLKGTTEVAGKTVPALYLGDDAQTGTYAVVDRVKSLAGGTATLFVWDGTNFTRVSTNVQKPDGSRAVGTVLTPTGKAFTALASGQSFHGVVDILGSPYTTSYEPIRDANGKLIGAWYTGYRLDSIASLEQAVADAKVLDHGIVALLKPTGVAVGQSRSTDADRVAKLRADHKGWVVHEATYPAWNYTVLTAYPRSDVTVRFLKEFVMMGAGAVALVLLLAALQFVLLKRQVLRPVLHLAERMKDADLNTLLESGRDDEIGTMSESFNQFVLRLRQTLLQVRDGSAASTAKSGEIRTISSDTVSHMARQSERAQDAFSAVSALSQNIGDTAANTGEASERARAAADAARLGRELVTMTSSKMQELTDQTQSSATRVATLTERAQKIGSIVGVIEEIAAGTNLLALNASIEAARAGEQGRGFAVVAGEVRRLAERTAAATQQVSELVRGIEEETGLVASDIENACVRASEGAEAVFSLNSKFEEIAQLVAEVDGEIGRLAEAARSEASSANAVSATMQEVAQSAQQSAQGAEQVVAVSNELLRIANSLEGAVHTFHIAELPRDRAA